MIDVIRVSASLVELHEVADDLDEIFLRENRLAGGTIREKALIDFVSPDTTKVVALRREEETLERLLRSLAIGRIARTKKRVDLLQRFFFSVSRILRKRVLDQHRLGASRGDEHANLVDLVLADLSDESIAELVAALRQNLAGLWIDDIHRDHLATFGAFAALDRIHLLAEIDPGVRRENLDFVDLQSAQTIENLFGE